MSKIVLEVFRNTPPGNRCKTLTKNVLSVVSEEPEDVEVKLLSFPSPKAKFRGVESAPALVINAKKPIPGILSEDEIKLLLRDSQPLKVGIILTKSPQRDETTERVLAVINQAIQQGNRADLFLVSDGILTAKKGISEEIEEKIHFLVRSGGSVLVSSPHLKASGFNQAGLIDSVEIKETPYDSLVDSIMEDWDRVVLI